MSTLKLSSPADMKKAHPHGWESATKIEAMPRYEAKEITDGVDAIVFEVIRKIEAALYSHDIVMTHRNDANRRSVTFTVNIEIESEKLTTDLKQRLPRPSNKEITSHYQQAGWDGIHVWNRVTTRSELPMALKRIKVRLTHWQHHLKSEIEEDIAA